jgi:ribulose-5-phosphate 4-epimerase/fuculose-1-phosphate aldolase
MNAEKNLVNLMKYMFSKRLISARDGNVSFKPKNSNYFLISPSSVKKNDLHQNQIIKVNFDKSKTLEYNTENSKPSRELFMHSLLLTNDYFYDKDTFVIHAHPPNIISYMGFNENRELNTIKSCFPEINVGNIGKNVKYHDAGSMDLANNCYENLLKYDLVGLERHGTLSIDSDSDKIIEDIETLEYYIGSYLKAEK